MKGKLRGQTKTSADLKKDGEDGKVAGFYGDDDVDLDTLVRREKVGGTDNYTKNYERNIMNAGKRYREANSDEDETYDLGKWEHKSKKMDQKKFEDRERKNQIRDSRRMQKNLESCEFCVDSQVFHRNKDAVLAQSTRAMVMVDKMKHATAFDQLIILPTSHCHAITHLEDEVYDEIRNYQKCVIEFFKKKHGMSVIFMETARYQTSNEQQLLGGGPHCRIEYLLILNYNYLFSNSKLSLDIGEWRPPSQKCFRPQPTWTRYALTVVSTPAFQACGPGSIPGRRISFAGI